MRRQSSILSFLKKPSDAFAEPQIHGTDTPPEKPRRSPHLAFPHCHVTADVDRSTRPFSTIMHKFVRADPKCDQVIGSSFSSRPISDTPEKEHTHVEDVLSHDKQSQLFKSLGKDNCDRSGHLISELDCDVLGPETPAMQPAVSRLKRLQDFSNNDADCEPLFKVPTKRLKSILDSVADEKSQDEECEKASSKFDWLNPSKIRDENGRRPNDPLYDKKTLYIPPDALKKMSASQRQYWNVKRHYMDVLLFFKVGKFYELYEVDAETGQRELDWKMTISGVGKCRQVGISEAGIDDAVHKLMARGYKVGRMEQLETSDQAKSRGATSVIERKLVSVCTPSMTIDNNTPEAVHLLALKEETRLENNVIKYGFAFLDYAALKFWVGSICDDHSCAALGTLLMQISPREIIYEHPGLSKDTYKAIKKYASAEIFLMSLKLGR